MGSNSLIKKFILQHLVPGHQPRLPKSQVVPFQANCLICILERLATFVAKSLSAS